MARRLLLAGANSIFNGDKLRTIANVGDSADTAWFAKLSLEAMETENLVGYD